MAKKKLRSTLDKQLKLYSAVAAGVLAMAPPADAAVHYSGLKNLPVNSSTSQYVDLNGDGLDDFKFGYAYWTSSPNSWGRGPFFYGLYGAGHIWGSGTAYCFDAIKFASNYQIKATLIHPHFSWRTSYWDSLNGTFTGVIGNCQGNFNNTTGFLGVRFHSSACYGGDFNYGWIRYHGDTQVSGVASGTIMDWAYEDTCNVPIYSGETANDFYVSKNDVTCTGHTPCFTKIQDALASALEPTKVKVTQEAYTEDITLDSDQSITLEGGWDTNFASKTSLTTVQSLTINNGTMVIENIILK